MPGHPDGAKAAFAESLEQLGGPDAITFFFRTHGRTFRAGSGAGDERRAFGIAEERVGAGGLDAQALDFKVQFGVFTAGFDKKGIALRFGKFEGADEDVFGGG